MPHLPDSHHDHDAALVAAFAAGDATGPDLDQARELVAACTPCATLHRDLVAIAAAVGTLPAPRRTRDYRLTAEQAAALRPSGWRRVLAPFAGPRFRLAAPLGTTMATLGVAGLLIAAMPGSAGLLQLQAASPGGDHDPYGGGTVRMAGDSPMPDATEGANAPSPSAGPAAAPGAPSGAPASQAPASGRPPTATDGRDGRPEASPMPQASPSVDSTYVLSPASGSWQPLAVASTLLFVLGALLVGGRLLARRAAAV